MTEIKRLKQQTSIKLGDSGHEQGTLKGSLKIYYTCIHFDYYMYFVQIILLVTHGRNNATACVSFPNFVFTLSPSLMLLWCEDNEFLSNSEAEISEYILYVTSDKT